MALHSGPLLTSLGTVNFLARHQLVPNHAILDYMTTSTTASPYRGFRYPQEIISHAVWLYFRFSLSYRDVEDLLAERGIVVSYETIRQWSRKFGQAYANQLRRRRARPSDKWFLDVRRFTRRLIPIADGKGYKGDLWVNQLTLRRKSTGT